MIFAQTQGEIPWPTLAKSDWPMGHHDPQSTGRSPFKGPQNARYIKKYDFHSGVFSGPAIGLDDRLYFGGYASGFETKFYSSDLNGKVLWSYTEPFYGNMSTPVLQTAEGVLFIGSENKNLFAFNPDGSIKWKYYAASPVDAPSNCITVNLDSTIYFGTINKYIFAVRPDGSLKWKVKHESGFFDIAPVISPDGNTLYICGADSNLYALHKDGSVKWKFSCPGNNNNSPLVDNEGNIYHYFIQSGKLVLLSIRPDASIRWKYATTDTCYLTINAASPTIDKNGNIYFTAVFQSGSWMYSVNYNGEFRWCTILPDAGMGIAQQLICDSGGTVYCGSTSGSYYYAVSSAGKLLWQIPLNDYQVDNTGAISKDGVLYIGVHLSATFHPQFGTLIAISDNPITVEPEKETKTAGFHLFQNYPNPFNPATKIAYTIPAEGDVTLDVYNTLGGYVTTLVSGRMSPGYYEVEFNGNSLSSGIYYYTLLCGNFRQTRKLILLR